MKALSIISGKGGTGKTSICASFASLAKNKVIVDADTDAADMHLVLTPDIKKRSDFKGGHVAVINRDLCSQCGECQAMCQFNAVSNEFVIDAIACEGCGICVHFCPENAIEFPQKTCGQWYISDTRHGPMIHAKLGIAEENSGKLVTILRKQAAELAETKNLDLIITDGPPGLGCPVIASAAGADMVLIITEPTLSGMHDMERVKKLTDFLKIPAMLCINKYDLNPDISRQMESFAKDNNMGFAGTIPYDRDVTAAMVAGKALVEFSDGPGAESIRKIWNAVSEFLWAV